MILLLRNCFVTVLLILMISSCRKAESVIIPPIIPERGGIALTFDDYSVENWHKYIDLFDSLNVKCTFYVSNYNKLNALQKSKLQILKSHGHEIAFHSTNHLNFVETLQSKGYKKLMDQEVNQGMELMRKDGFSPTTFAYPYGAHNLILDKGLLQRFQSIRTLNGTHDLNNSLHNLSGNTIIRGLGVDESSKRATNNIYDLLTNAHDLNKCAVLLVHNIEMHGTNLQIPLWKLKNLIVKAKSLKLHFYTISEISRK